MTLEPYQKRAAEWLSRRRKGCIKIAAGGGKTLVMAAALDAVLAAKPRHHRVKIGWMCNTREQADQAGAALRAFQTINALADVKVACAAANTDWSDCAVLVVDEVHHAGSAPSWQAQMETCQGAIWGCSATPDTGDAEAYAKLLAMFDGELFEVDRDEVQRSRLVKATVRMIDASDPCGLAIEAEIQRLLPIRRKQMRFAADGDLYRMVAWQAVADIGIAQNTARNNAAARLARQHIQSGDRVLLLVNHTEHGETMRDLIGPGAELCHSKVGKKKRRELIEGARSGQAGCLIATSLADEGFDAPVLNVLILASGGRSKVKAEQRTGRVLRAFCGKDRGIIYDFLDRQHKLMARHSEARQQLYKSLGYEIKLGSL